MNTWRNLEIKYDLYDRKNLFKIIMNKIANDIYFVEPIDMEIFEEYICKNKYKILKWSMHCKIPFTYCYTFIYEFNNDIFIKEICLTRKRSYFKFVEDKDD